MRRFFALFIGLMLVLFYIDLQVPVQKQVVVPFTGFLATISSYIASFFDPGTISYDRVLQSPNGIAVRIDNGCNGIEACIVLISAMVAFPSTWMQKLAGIVIGLLAVQAVNILRIVCLFFLAQWDMDVFQFFHVYLWPSLIMLDVLVVFLLWMRYCQNRLPPDQQPSEPSVAHGILKNDHD